MRIHFSQTKLAIRVLFAVLAVVGCVVCSGCGSPADSGADLALSEDAVAACPATPARDSVSPPPEVACSNAALTAYDGLLILAPHPDDETLAFAGLRRAYEALGKKVEIVVVTDGDAYCEACQFWKNTGFEGETCNALDLSNLQTLEVDSFAEIRRDESRASAAVLEAGTPEFLGYPDTGLAKAWQNVADGHPEKPLHRSDFSACNECGTCGDGYGGGPPTELDANRLRESLRARIAATSPRTLVATTHPLDGHGDHAALGHFVEGINQQLETPRPLLFGVIHAHTPKDHSHADCWFPGPTASFCGCMDPECSEDGKIAEMRAFRFRPEWPSALPDDADYGEAIHLCLEEDLYVGADSLKLRSIESYASQLGFLSRDGAMPEHLAGTLDCSGYLISFVRRTESFVLVDPAAPPIP